MTTSTFSPLGLPIGENNINMTYLYGLSDFFAVMFENPETINLLLEGQSQTAADIYSKFLQITSQISLEEIQTTSGQTMTLAMIKDTDAVEGQANTYRLAQKIVSSRYVANRPLLPTSLLEENSDYKLEMTSSGAVQVRFAKPLSQLGFPTRLLPDGTTKEYALWFVDSEIDEQWISKHYGELIGLKPEASSEVFKNYVYGLFYVYANGPTLELMRKGLNLTLGIPLCRGDETVLDIRKYLETDQYIVITDLNQYVIPYGLDPIVEIGQVLTTSDELAQWVEVKDYINDGEWWVNLHIPPSVIPAIPSGQVNRYAYAGSHFDELMRNYLKKHTFLVNVKVSFFKDIQIFQELSDIIRTAKPTYTEAIYIWTVDTIDETITLDDDQLAFRWDQFRCDHISYGIEKFYRNNSTNPLKRGCPTFIRYNAPFFVSQMSGRDQYINGDPSSFMGGISRGFINPNRQYRTNTPEEKAWISTIHERGSEVCLRSRDKVAFTRGVLEQHGEEINEVGINSSNTLDRYTGITEHVFHDQLTIPKSMKIIPMYITNQKDLEIKCATAGVDLPPLSTWYFKLFQPIEPSRAINAIGVNGGVTEAVYGQLRANFDTFKARSNVYNYLGSSVPPQGMIQWAPADVSFVNRDDFLAFARIQDDVVGVYLVTSNFSLDPEMFYAVEGNDAMQLSFETRPSRGLALSSSSFYVTRGRGELDYNSNTLGINRGQINSSVRLEPDIAGNEFSDMINTPRRILTRGGDKVLHRFDSK